MKREPEEIRGCEIIAVIRVELCRGSGANHNNTARRVMQYYSPAGELLAENDPCPDGKHPIQSEQF